MTIDDRRMTSPLSTAIVHSSIVARQSTIPSSSTPASARPAMSRSRWNSAPTACCSTPASPTPRTRCRMAHRDEGRVRSGLSRRTRGPHREEDVRERIEPVGRDDYAHSRRVNATAKPRPLVAGYAHSHRDDRHREHKSRTASRHSGKSNTNPDSSNRVGTTRRLFRISPVSVRMSTAPISNIHLVAGNPIFGRMPPPALTHAFRNARMNSALGSGFGDARLTGRTTHRARSASTPRG